MKKEEACQVAPAPVLTDAVALAYYASMCADDSFGTIDEATGRRVRSRDISDETGVYQTETGVWCQLKPRLDGAGGNALDEEATEIAARISVVGSCGAWSQDDDVGHSIGLDAVPDEDWTPPTEVEPDDRYAELAKRCHVVASYADTVYHRGVAALIRRRANHNGRGRRQPMKAYFVSQRQQDAGRLAYVQSQAAFRNLSDHEKAEWARGDETIERHYARLRAETVR